MKLCITPKDDATFFAAPMQHRDSQIPFGQDMSRKKTGCTPNNSATNPKASRMPKYWACAKSLFLALGLPKSESTSGDIRQN
jgi:hypothetical protein